MRVTVTLFARLRELAGRETLAIDVPAGASVADVWDAVGTSCPDVVPFGASVSCAVNAEFARRHTVVRDGDDVAFLPPVSGGADS
jgi:molybdopterin converting factor subunit 1